MSYERHLLDSSIVERARRRGTASDFGDERSPLLGGTRSIRSEVILSSRENSNVRDRSVDNDQSSFYSWNGVASTALGNLPERLEYSSQGQSGDENGRRESDSDKETVKGGNSTGSGTELLIDAEDGDEDDQGNSHTPVVDPGTGTVRGRPGRAANGRGGVPMYGATLSESPSKS